MQTCLAFVVCHHRCFVSWGGGGDGLTGQPAGNSDLTLPRHVTVADLGPGRLHRNLKPPSNPNQVSDGGGEWERHRGIKDRNKTTNSKSNIDDDDNEEVEEITLPRQGSVGNIKNRLHQGERAVWGGRGAPDGPAANGGSSGGDDGSGGMAWWETGTRYAFQPRLAADKATVLSFVDTTGGRRGRGVDIDQRGGPRKASSGDGDGVSRAGILRQEGEGLSRIVQVPESNDNHGQRVFFLA